MPLITLRHDPLPSESLQGGHAINIFIYDWRELFVQLRSYHVFPGQNLFGMGMLDLVLTILEHSVLTLKKNGRQGTASLSRQRVGVFSQRQSLPILT